MLLLNKLHALIIPFKIEIIEKRHTVFLPDLIFKLQQEVSKLNDICLSWSSPRTVLETNFLNLENRSFEKGFSQ